MRTTSRRAIADHTLRIAVWDIDHVFPALEQTLERMNERQASFGFELVDLSAPLDAWDLEEEDGTPYLWAERLAGRLQSKTVELRVNLLLCVTRHWMRDDDTVNIYAWWPAGRQPPVATLSCAGFDDLAAEGLDTDRVIANVAVSVLAGFFGDVDSHKRGPHSCPLYLNEERDLANLTGRESFDPTCRRRLKKKLKAAELKSLDALLGTFDERPN